MTLQSGKHYRYGNGIFICDLVNASRAHLTPVGKRKVKDADGDDVFLRDMSVSANSCLEMITDVETASDKIELEMAERELKQAQKEVLSEQQQTARKDLEELAAVEAEIVALRAAGVESVTTAPPAATLPGRASTGGGWHIGPEAHPHFRAGTLAADVMAFIKANPGAATKTIVEGVTTDGAVAACVSRFNQAGYIHKA